MKYIYLLIIFSILSFSQTSREYSVELKAEVDVNTPSITISWQAVQYAEEYTVLRKIRNQPNFQQISGVLDSETLSFVDKNVEVGNYYEYQVRTKSDNGNGRRFRGFGYIAVTINTDFPGWWGNCLIIVDETIDGPLETEITRLMDDLIKEGWSPIKRTVSRAEEYDGEKVQDVKEIILSEYETHEDINAIFLLGRVAVPYAGNFVTPPDGHAKGAGNHHGAWPADCYYGELNGNWTDNSTNITDTRSERNNNTPGDGKFDSAIIADWIDIPVGRVDFYDLPAFEETEIELLRRYLDKNHNYRSGELEVLNKALIDDDRFTPQNLGFREAFSSSGWRNFAQFVGSENIVRNEWIDNIFINNYLLSYGTGAGSFTSASGVINSNQLSDNTINAVFTFLFGSYFGNWNERNNLMRAAIASEGSALTCGWAARPHWYMHHMSAGEPIGNSLLTTQNNPNTYTNATNNQLRPNEYYGLAIIEDANVFGQGAVIPEGIPLGFSNLNTHVALMGDPTLKPQIDHKNIAAAPTDGNATILGPEEVEISWDGGPEDDIKFWTIYKSIGSIDGPYELATEEIVDTESFIDEVDFENVLYYMVKRKELIDNPYTGTKYVSGEGLIIESDMTIFANVEEGEPQGSFTINPNPALDNITIDLSSFAGKDITIEILDISGRIVKSFNKLELNGKASINWNFGEHLNNGSYFVNLKSDNINISNKFIVLK